MRETLTPSVQSIGNISDVLIKGQDPRRVDG